MKTQLRKFFGVYKSHVPEVEVRQTLHRMLGEKDWKMAMTCEPGENATAQAGGT